MGKHKRRTLHFARHCIFPPLPEVYSTRYPKMVFHPSTNLQSNQNPLPCCSLHFLSSLSSPINMLLSSHVSIRILLDSLHTIRSSADKHCFMIARSVGTSARLWTTTVYMDAEITKTYKYVNPGALCICKKTASVGRAGNILIRSVKSPTGLSANYRLLGLSSS